MRYSNLFFVHLCCCLLTSASLAGEIADLFSAQVPNPHTVTKKPKNFRSLAAHSHEISEIGLERTGCFGSCPVYSVVISDDLTIKYVGEKHVPHAGEFHGKIRSYNYHNVAEAIDAFGYMTLADMYTMEITDQSTVYTTIVQDGMRKVVCNYADAGPRELWIIEELIDGLLQDASWQNGQGPFD